MRRAQRGSRAMRRALALVFAVALVATTISADAATVSPYTYTKTEGFDGPNWWRTWGLTAAPWHTSVVTEGASRFLRVGFPAGSHDGTSFKWSTGTSDTARIRYRIRLGSTWQSSGGKLPGFGSPVYDSKNQCQGGCGLLPADGITSWSARGHINAQGVAGSYLYVPNHSEWAFQWNTAALVPGRWYTIDYWVTMNTPGQNNGALKAAIDGNVVLNRTDMSFRQVSTLHVGTAWFDFYYGGSSVPPTNMWIDIDEATIDW